MIATHSPDGDVVEFEIEHLPAPLRWHDEPFRVTWARDPEVPPQDRAKWDAVLNELTEHVVREAGTHVPASTAVDLGLNYHTAPSTMPLLMIHIKALRSLFPLPFLAKNRLTAHNIRYVEQRIYYMQKGAVR